MTLKSLAKNVIKTPSGQVFLEAVFVLLAIALPILFFALETIRQTHMHLFLRHACFLYVRQKTLGHSEDVAQQAVIHFAKKYFHQTKYYRWLANTRYRFMEGISNQAVLKVRFQRFFPWNPRSRYQITKKCKF